MNTNTRSSLDCQNQTQYWHPSTISPSRSRFKGCPQKIQVESDQCLRAAVKVKAQQGNFPQAIALLTQLIDRHPTSAMDYNNRGLIYFQSGQLANAIADYNTALQLNPTLDSAYNNRANYYAAMGSREQAIADYESALDLNPGNIRAWINQGITLRELGRYDEALDSFDFVLHFGQLTGHIYAERGRTHDLNGDWNCAIADYQRALIHLPESQAAIRLRSQVETWMNQLLSPLSLEF
jgi:tetratricopeptide (TPR) repeat protein